MKTKKIGMVGIAATFIGTVVGAGLVSGQEVLQFFGNYGFGGLLGTVLVAIAFATISYATMHIAYRTRCANFEDVVIPPIKTLRAIVNIYILIFSFGILSVMYAGSGSVLKTLFGVNSSVGSILMAVVVLAVCWFGSDSTLNSFVIIVPVMAGISILTSIAAIMNGAETIFMPPIMELSIKSNWMISSLIYVSYNMCVTMAVLVPLGVMAKNNVAIAGGAVIGGGVLGLFAMAVCAAIIKNYHSICAADMPMLDLAKIQNPLLGGIYTFVLVAGIFTTAAGVMFAILERLHSYNISIFKNRRLMLILLTITGFIGSNVGFTELVGVIYPLSGYLGFVIIGCLIFNFIVYKKSVVKTQANDKDDCA